MRSHPCCFQHSVQKRGKFTGKERDSESGLDNFDFRYYASSLGRFMKPDDSLVYWDRSDPQSLNLYSYAENNPVSNTDPDGHDCVYLNNAGNGVESVDQSSSSGECGGSGGYWVQGAVTNAQINGDSLELTGTTNGVNNNTSASYLTNGDVPLNPFAQQALGQAGVLAAPGVNLAAKGLEIFGWMYSAPAMLLATCASGGPGSLNDRNRTAGDPCRENGWQCLEVFYYFSLDDQVPESFDRLLFAFKDNRNRTANRPCRENGGNSLQVGRRKYAFSSPVSKQKRGIRAIFRSSRWALNER